MFIALALPCICCDALLRRVENRIVLCFTHIGVSTLTEQVGLAAALAAEVTQRQDLEGVAHRGAEEGHLVGEGPEEVEEGGEEQEVAQE